MQSCAFARPTIRLSLKIVNTSGNKANWTYAPNKPNTKSEDAAWKIVGKKCASQCVRCTVEADGYVLEGFLPRANAAKESISGIGSFMTLDKRPMMATRGTLKDMVKLFRKKLNETLVGTVRDPFSWFALSCPIGAYDINIEPAKDDVLFHDEQIVIQLTKELLNSVYAKAKETPDLDEQSPPPLQSNQLLAKDISQILEQNADDKMSEGQSMSHPKVSATPSAYDHDQIEDISRVPPVLNQTWHSNMYGWDEGDEMPISNRRNSPVHDQETQESLRSVAVSNPWTFAKMAAPNRPARIESSDMMQIQTPQRIYEEDLNIDIPTPDVRQENPIDLVQMPLTPEQTSPIIREHDSIKSRSENRPVDLASLYPTPRSETSSIIPETRSSRSNYSATISRQYGKAKNRLNSDKCATPASSPSVNIHLPFHTLNPKPSQPLESNIQEHQSSRNVMERLTRPFAIPSSLNSEFPSSLGRNGQKSRYRYNKRKDNLVQRPQARGPDPIPTGQIDNCQGDMRSFMTFKDSQRPTMCASTSGRAVQSQCFTAADDGQMVIMGPAFEETLVDARPPTKGQVEGDREILAYLSHPPIIPSGIKDTPVGRRMTRARTKSAATEFLLRSSHPECEVQNVSVNLRLSTASLANSMVKLDQKDVYVGSFALFEQPLRPLELPSGMTHEVIESWSEGLLIVLQRNYPGERFTKETLMGQMLLVFQLPTRL